MTESADPKKVFVKAAGATASAIAAVFFASLLYFDRAHGKLQVILAGSACIACLSLVVVALTTGEKRSKLLAGGGAALGAVAALAQLLGSPPEPNPVPKPSVTARAVLPRTAVPQELVGTWSGGTDGATANWTYTFAAEGDVQHSNGRIGVQQRGTVVIKGTQLTLYFPDTPPETFRWQVQPIDPGYGYRFTALQLNGLSYVRQDAEPTGN